MVQANKRTGNRGLFINVHRYVVNFLDKIFSWIAIISGHAYIILIVANICIFSAMYVEEPKVDITISIATMLLDMVIISQNNKINQSNTRTLNTIYRIENKILKIEELHTKQLNGLHSQTDRLGVQIDKLYETIKRKRNI